MNIESIESIDSFDDLLNSLYGVGKYSQPLYSKVYSFGVPSTDFTPWLVKMIKKEQFSDIILLIANFYDFTPERADSLKEIIKSLKDIIKSLFDIINFPFEQYIEAEPEFFVELRAVNIMLSLSQSEFRIRISSDKYEFPALDKKIDIFSNVFFPYKFCFKSKYYNNYLSKLVKFFKVRETMYPHFENNFNETTLTTDQLDFPLDYPENNQLILKIKELPAGTRTHLMKMIRTDKREGVIRPLWYEKGFGTDEAISLDILQKLAIIEPAKNFLGIAHSITYREFVPIAKLAGVDFNSRSPKKIILSKVIHNPDVEKSLIAYAKEKSLLQFTPEFQQQYLDQINVYRKANIPRFAVLALIPSFHQIKSTNIQKEYQFKLNIEPSYSFDVVVKNFDIQIKTIQEEKIRGIDISLMEACIDGDTKLVKTLLDKGTNITSIHGVALMEAITRGYTEIVKLLLDKGVNLNKRCPGNGSEFPLIEAASKGNVNILKILLDKGANVNVVNIFGVNALKAAINKNFMEIVKILLDQGINFNEQDDIGNTALTYAVEKGHTEIVKLLLEKGADFNISNMRNNTKLMEASRNGNTEIVKLLLEKGADVNFVDRRGETALMEASANGNTEIVKLLLEKGADVDLWDNVRWTALMKASRNGHAEIVKLLLEKGADVDFASMQNVTALKLAHQYCHIRIIGFLMDHGAKLSPIKIKK